MSFYSDFITQSMAMGSPELAARLATIQHQLIGILPENVRLSVSIPAEIPERLREQAAREATHFIQTSVIMKRAKIVRLMGAQAQVFLEAPPVEGQDYVRWLRLPYKELYIQLDPPITFHDYAGEYDAAAPAAVVDPPKADGVLVTPAEEIAKAWRRGSQTVYQGEPRVSGVILLECPGTEIKRLGFRNLGEFGQYVSDSYEIDMSQCERVLQVCFLLPLPDYFLNTHLATLCVMKDGKLLYSREGLWHTRKRMLDWAIHLINFLASPSVKMVPQEPPAALQRARARRGKPPLPGWYEITYRKVIEDYTREKFLPAGTEKRWEHSFRYDVRGHFRRYDAGPMTGRVVWVRAHQRGLKHRLYKPKVYRTANEPEAEPPTPWAG